MPLISFDQNWIYYLISTINGKWNISSPDVFKILEISRISNCLWQWGSQYFPKAQNTLLDSIFKTIFPKSMKLQGCKTVAFSNMTNWIAPFYVHLQRILHNG